MGTNYYHETHRACPHCGKPVPEAAERRHIGKSSAGWCFALHVYPEEGLLDLQDWLVLWREGTIVDEYGKSLSTHQMLAVILVRYQVGAEPLTPQWLVDNSAQRGPLGLARAALSDRVFGHGFGTYDRIRSYGSMEDGW